MKKINQICHNPQSVTSTFIITNLFFLLFLLGTNPANAQGNSKAGQWAKAGGEIILSGNHNFTQTWSSHAYSRQDNNKYWPGGFWGKREPQIPFDDVVKNSVYPLKGQITVLGPGNIGLFQKGKKGARIVMNDSKTKVGFVPWTNTIETLKDYNVNGEFWGSVPAGTEITLDITAVMNIYNNQGGTGEISFIAPQEIEYEIWYFPREGGKVISVGEVNVFGEIDSDEPGHSVGEVPSGKTIGKVTSGKVFNETTNKWLNPGDNVRIKHVLTTGKSGNATITVFAFGKSTIVKLSNSTKIKFKDKITKKKCSGLSLFAGRVWSLFSGKKKNGFAVETFNSVAGVEGTEFETTYNPETGETSVSVFEGIVSFECRTGTAAPAYLKAGMSASMDKNCNITSDNSIFNNANTINSGNTFYPIADSHVYAYSYLNWDKANWGKYEVLGAGWNSTGGEKRAYLKFDISGIDKSTFEKASLKLFHYHTAGGNSAELGVYTVRSPWNEGNGNYKPTNVAAPGEVCWISQPQSDQYPVAYFNPGTQTNDFVEVDITALVKSWLEGMPNHGLAIKVGENYLNGPTSVYGFYSREYKDIDKRPSLIINDEVLTANTTEPTTNLLKNGSFEDPPAGWYKSFNPGQDVSGWKVVNAAVDLTGSYFKSSEGKQSMDLHGSPGFGGVEQTFTTRHNQKYRVVFDFSGNPAGIPKLKRMRVSAARQSKVFEFDCTGKTTTQMGWTTQSWSFTANSSSTTIRFETLSSSGMANYGPAIDNVKIFSVEGLSNLNTANVSNISIAGQWRINQHNGYDGTLNLYQNQSGRITGIANWNQYDKGTIDGQLSGNSIEFTISYASGDYGKYTGTVTQNGIRIANGFHKAKNSKTASWDATKAINESNSKIYRWHNLKSTDYADQRESIATDSQMRSWGYGEKKYLFTGYIVTKNKGEKIALYSYYHPEEKDWITTNDELTSEVQMKSWGYKDRTFLCYVFRNKLTSDYREISSWRHPKEIDWVTTTQSIATDAQMRSWGYVDKKILGYY